MTETSQTDTLALLDLAVQARLAADQALTEAMVAARLSGHSANEIGRRATPVHSRPVTLTIINTGILLRRAARALMEGGLTNESVCLSEDRRHRPLIHLHAASGDLDSAATAVYELLTAAGLDLADPTDTHDDAAGRLAMGLEAQLIDANVLRRAAQQYERMGASLAGLSDVLRPFADAVRRHAANPD